MKITFIDKSETSGGVYHIANIKFRTWGKQHFMKRYSASGIIWKTRDGIWSYGESRMLEDAFKSPRIDILAQCAPRD